MCYNITNFIELAWFTHTSLHDFYAKFNMWVQECLQVLLSSAFIPFDSSYVERRLEKYPAKSSSSVQALWRKCPARRTTAGAWLMAVISPVPALPPTFRMFSPARQPNISHLSPFLGRAGSCIALWPKNWHSCHSSYLQHVPHFPPCTYYHSLGFSADMQYKFKQVPKNFIGLLRILPNQNTALLSIVCAKSVPPTSSIKMRNCQKKLAHVFAYTHAYTQIHDKGGTLCPPRTK